MSAAVRHDPPTVLLVDDDRDALALLEAVLADGHRTVSALDGEHAWTMLAGDGLRPDLVICDLGMPRMSGDELVVRMRHTPQLRNIPVILLTGRDSERARLEMLDAGVSDYLLKPFRPEELRLRVRNILRGSLLLRQVQEARHATEAANRELQEVNHELDRFAATAAHDLQAPLANIAAYAALLADGAVGDADRRSQLLGAIASQAEGARTLVGELLQHARAITSSDEVTTVALDDVLDAAMAHLRPQLERASVELRRPGPLGTVAVRPVALESLLLNLLSNALKYRAGERRLVIEVASRPSPTAPGFTEVTVRDNGRGLAPGDHERVLELGVQGSGAEPGTGIGLATVRAVVHRHGGEIALLDSPAPGGLTVRFTLPSG